MLLEPADGAAVDDAAAASFLSSGHAAARAADAGAAAASGHAACTHAGAAAALHVDTLPAARCALFLVAMEARDGTRPASCARLLLD